MTCILFKSASPQHLQEVSVPLLTYAECQADWGSTVTEGNICAGTAPDDTTGVGTCQVLYMEDAIQSIQNDNM